MIIPGNLNCDIRDVHWLEPNAFNEPSKDSTFLLYYQTSELKSRLRKRRLVSTGLNGTAIEWDLSTLKPKSKYAGNTAIWQSKMLGKYLYLACEDGTVKILKVRKNKIELVKSLFKVDKRCLSLDLIQTSPDEK